MAFGYGQPTTTQQRINEENAKREQRMGALTGGRPGSAFSQPAQQEKSPVPDPVAGVQKPAAAPNYASVLKRQVGDYRDFTQNRGRLSDEQFNPFANKTRADLAGSIKKVRNDYNSRGLLGSGMQKGSEVGARNDANTYLAQKRMEINQGLLDTQRGMEAGIFNTASAMARPGLNTAGPALDRMRTDVAAQIEDDAASQELINSIISGGSGLAGYGLAQSMYSNGNNPWGNTVAGYNPWMTYSGSSPGPWSK